MWPRAKAIDEPTSKSASTPTQALAGSNVVCMPTPEPTLESTRTLISPTQFARRELAKRHAHAFVQHLIIHLNETHSIERLLTCAEMQEAYFAFCEAKNAVPRPWNSVATYVNRLIRQNGKRLKPYKDLINPKTKELEKFRVYEIPVEIPPDWRKRLEG